VIFTSVAASSFASAQSQAPSFNIGRNDQQTMANLALAINQCPGTNQRCRATSSGLIVTLVVANPQGIPALPSMTSGQGSIVASTPTLTAAPVIVSGNTIVIAGQTLTATVATQNTTNFIVGATDNATLLNIVTTIAANGTLSPLVTGSVVGNTLTITAAGTSPYYNTYAVTTTGSTMEPQWPTLVFGQLSTQAILHFGY
jgi:guanyl-specific ribonuclease Sa